MAAPFPLLAGALFAAAVGWFRRQFWGWLLGVTLISINLAGDLFNLVLSREWLGGMIGIAIAGSLLACMIHQPTRKQFSRTDR
jgi:hypothetical protein